MAISDVIIVMLATYRLAADVALEDGPWLVFSRLRGLITQRFGADHWITRGAHCPICMSLWLSLAMLPLARVAPAIIAWLAVAGAARALIVWLEAR